MIRVLAVCVAALPASIAVGIPSVQAKNGDTHIIGVGIVETIDCNDSTLFVNGTANTITTKGTCWAVAIQGSSNTVVADTVINDITVYGWDETAYFHNGDPALIDIGRQLGAVNRLERVPA